MDEEREKYRTHIRIVHGVLAHDSLSISEAASSLVSVTVQTKLAGMDPGSTYSAKVSQNHENL